MKLKFETPRPEGEQEALARDQIQYLFHEDGMFASVPDELGSLLVQDPGISEVSEWPIEEVRDDYEVGGDYQADGA